MDSLKMACQGRMVAVGFLAQRANHQAVLGHLGGLHLLLDVPDLLGKLGLLVPVIQPNVAIEVGLLAVGHVAIGAAEHLLLQMELRDVNPQALDGGEHFVVVVPLALLALGDGLPLVGPVHACPNPVLLIEFF